MIDKELAMIESSTEYHDKYASVPVSCAFIWVGESPYVKITWELLKEIGYSTTIAHIWFGGFYLDKIDEDEIGGLFRRADWKKFLGLEDRKI
jgi:hypothetical protein